MADARQAGRARGGEMAGFLVGTAGLTALWLALPAVSPQEPGSVTERDVVAAPLDSPDLQSPVSAAPVAVGPVADASAAPDPARPVPQAPLVVPGEFDGIMADALLPTAPGGAGAIPTSSPATPANPSAASGAGEDRAGTVVPNGEPHGTNTVAAIAGEPRFTDASPTVLQSAPQSASPSEPPSTATDEADAVAVAGATPPGPISGSPDAPATGTGDPAVATPLPSVETVPTVLAATAAPELPGPRAMPGTGTSLAGNEVPGDRPRLAALPTIEADLRAVPGEAGGIPEAGTTVVALDQPGPVPDAASVPLAADGTGPRTGVGPLRPAEANADPVAIAGAPASPALTVAEVATLPATPPEAPRRVVLGDGSTAGGVTIRRFGSQPEPTAESPADAPAEVGVQPDDMPGASTADSAAPGPTDLSAAAGDMPAWRANAAFWASVDPSRPPMAVILIDDGTADVPRLAEALPGPVSIALDPRLPDLADRTSAWRAAGAEVLILAALPRDATAADAAVVYQASVAAMPEAVALLDAGTGGLSGVGDVARLGLQEAAGRGIGVVLPPAGFASSPRDADGVPTVGLIRDVDGDGQDARAIGRFLDDAARRVGDAGGGAVLARATPESLDAVTAWLDSPRGQAVQVAPVSALFAAQSP